MAKTHDVCAVIGEKPDGKPRWMKCGAVIEKDGKLRLKLDAYPASGDGWFALFEPRDDRQQAPQQQAAPTQTPGAEPGLDDDIPF